MKNAEIIKTAAHILKFISGSMLLRAKTKESALATKVINIHNR